MPRSPVVMLLVFAFTLFTSATLLFLVEPMIGKMITPLLGGTPAVWNTCMVFFQAVLLAGYAYAHFSTTWLGARKQAALHIILLALPFLVLPLTVNRDLIQSGDNPVFRLLLLLSMTVGLPMFVVSASAPLLQKWFASTSHPAARDPYFLYGASNLGSMLALLAYPTLVEPHLGLGQQRIDWTIGYAILAALTALCAVFLWLSPRNVETSEQTEAKTLEGMHKVSGRSSEAIQPSKHGIRRNAPTSQPTPALETSPDHALAGDVTWVRILRWLALAFVPSSLMLGATTYITTDIAAIPLLWVAPLALYLLSFIIVFSHVPAWIQWLALTIEGAVICLLLVVFLWDLDAFATRPVLQLLVRTGLVLAIVGGIYLSCWGWINRGTDMHHRAMILVMPLLVLAMVFFMLSELKTKSLWIAFSLGLHLSTLFVVSMVCHGELARDRPAAKYLTGYFLWMSVGGVLGGMFNALLAPVIFTGIVEYELAMMLACFLAPPLAPVKETVWGLRFDAILAGMFALVGAVLIYLRIRDHDLNYSLLNNSPWQWQLAALILGIGVSIAVILRDKGRKADRAMDLVLPLCLGVLLVGLVWGLQSRPIWPRVVKLAVAINARPGYFFRILIYGTPIVLGYTFVERPMRFGLGVGAILLSAAFCGIFENSVTHQERSFFGVLKIADTNFPFRDEYYLYRSLNHGTTLHGTQYFLPPEMRDEPVTYYHHSGPMGELMMVFNGADTPPEKMNLAVVGLGTGTMACYARKGQHLTFYDIDPVVKRLSFDPGEDPFPFFTFVEDARERGAELELVMGDARLTMEKKELKDSEKYGFIVVDAFSSDAIPVHLITREAMQVFLDKLTEDGLLCFHISNRYLDLKPVLYNLARERNLSAVFQNDLHQDDDDNPIPYLFGKTSSTWVILSRSPERLNKLLELNDWEDKRRAACMALRQASLLPDNGTGLVGQAILMRNLLDDELCKRYAPWLKLEPEKDWPNLDTVGVWSDDYSNLFSVFSWR
ncbi:MAG: spermidine synthase [Gemmataceae bacterium]